MPKKTLIDVNGVLSIGAMATKCGVPALWLRNKVAQGEIACTRIGWNLFVSDDQIEKIKVLAAQRGK